MGKNDRKYETEKDRVIAQWKKQLEWLEQETEDPGRLKLFLRFVNGYRVNGSSPYTIRNHVVSLRYWNTKITCQLDEIDIDILHSALLDLDDEDFADTTKRGHKTNLKVFLKYLGREDLVKEIKIKRNKRNPIPDNLPEHDDTKILIDNALNPRDKALISLVYESGGRLGEVLEMNYNNALPHSHGYEILFPDGKTGFRKIIVVESAMYIRMWQTVHPKRNDPDAPLWCTLDGKYRLSVAQFRKIIKDAARRGSIGKRVNPHAFRHAQATECAKDFTEQEMKRYLGWTPDSRMAGTYVHLQAKDVESAMLRRYGIKTEEEEMPDRVSECPRCHQVVPKGTHFCGICGMPLTRDAHGESENLRAYLVEAPDMMGELERKLTEKIMQNIKNKNK